MEQDNIMKYYNSAELWDRPPLQNQLNIGDLVISKIPTDVKSILDVGSGNGVITNRLIDLFDRVCAVDISEEALKYVQAEKRIGSIDQLPFEDNEFDLILITDVLEHLPDPIFQQGIQELKRVAKKYVLIVTPFQEKLEFVQMKCKKCSCQFHVNLHIRSISKDTIESSFSNEFRIEELTLAGEEWPHFPEYASYFKSMFDYSNDWELAVCPQCGSRQDHEDRSENIKSTNPAFFDRIVDSIHLVMDDFRKQELMYNEALFLLSRDRYSEVKDSSF
ncbi:MAG TPA: class I SAM-dependent methyltransferase, partial [Bacillota bacterium]|nr:class I SAM-dependent methyltransferase [Bacillota bacterium]